MDGVQAYDCSQWHSACPGVQVIDVGGFAKLWCPTCRVYADLQAVSPKFASHKSAAQANAKSGRVTVGMQ